MVQRQKTYQSSPAGRMQIFRSEYKNAKDRLFGIFLFFGLEGFWGQPQGPNFPSPWAIMLVLRLDCPTAALTTPQKVLSLWRLVELKMLDFSDRTRTGISILTSAADFRLFGMEGHFFPLEGHLFAKQGHLFA